MRFQKNILKVSSVKDLGVWLSSDLSFKLHLEKIYKKALKVLGFIRRNTWEFNNPTCIKVLYCSLVCSILEYCSVVWNPFTNIWVNKLESIQNRFLKLLAPKLRLPINNISNVAKQCGLDPLTKRRLFNDVNYIYKLINNQIDCPDLLTKIKFKVPTYNSRNYLLII